MTVVFLSNYYNHHQAPFSEAMDRLTGGNYTFIETEPMESERVNMGWGEVFVPSFVRQSYADDNEYRSCIELVDSADIVITGSAPEKMIKARLAFGKPVFRYSERWYKQGFQRWKWPVRLVRHHFRHGRYRNSYMLCASAYTAADCAKTGLFLRKTYKWGYFPAARRYDDIEELLNKKERTSILWCGEAIAMEAPG